MYLSVEQKVKPWTHGDFLVDFTASWVFFQSEMLFLVHGKSVCVFKMNVYSEANSVKVNFYPKPCVSKHSPGFRNTLGYMLEGRPSFCGMLPHLF